LRWVIVELSLNGEREGDVNVIRSVARKILRSRDIRVFVPAVSQKVRDESQTLFFMDGYIFIEYRPGIPYLSLRDTVFFRDVLCNSTRSPNKEPSYSLLTDADLEIMRSGMQEMKRRSFRVGDSIRVMVGSYKNLRGEISVVYDEQSVQVSVSHLSSKRVLIDFPTTYLELEN